MKRLIASVSAAWLFASGCAGLLGIEEGKPKTDSGSGGSGGDGTGGSGGSGGDGTGGSGGSGGGGTGGTGGGASSSGGSGGSTGGSGGMGAAGAGGAMDECEDGYEPGDDGCVDVDECAEGLLTCEVNAECVNTEGSAECRCLPTFTGDPEACTRDSVTVTLEPSKDSYVSSSSSTTNYGSQEELILDRTNTEGFLQFDLSGVPENSVILTATFNMAAFEGYAYGGDGRVFIHAIQSHDWEEATLTWDTRPTEAGTWLDSWWIWYGTTMGERAIGFNNGRLVEELQLAVYEQRPVSLKLRAAGYWTSYHSREFAEEDKRPHITFSYVQGERHSLAAADATISSAAPSAIGSTSVLRAGTEDAVLLRFDLAAGLPAGSQGFVSALEMSTTESGAGDASLPLWLAGDSWDESSVTWTSRPPVSDELGAVMAASYPNRTRFQNSLLRFAAAEQHYGDALLSLAVSPEDSVSSGTTSIFFSKEGGMDTSQPSLEVLTAPCDSTCGLPGQCRVPVYQTRDWADVPYTADLHEALALVGPQHLDAVFYVYPEPADYLTALRICQVDASPVFYSTQPCDSVTDAVEVAVLGYAIDAEDSDLAAECGAQPIYQVPSNEIGRGRMTTGRNYTYLDGTSDVPVQAWLHP